jgi:HrpA-like RNA helicase
MIGAINENNKIKAQGKLLVKIPMEPMVSRSLIEGLFFN